MRTGFRLALAQINPTVGALRENRDLLAACLEDARRERVDLILFPELGLTGYPPEDLLLDRFFLEAVRRELETLIPLTGGMLAVIGCPLLEGGAVRNAAALLLNGRLVDTYAKASLPNYGVFDEKRYFRPGLRGPVYRWKSLTFGLNICEDLWSPQGIPAVQAAAGACLFLNISSSPFDAGKGWQRQLLLRHRARQHGAAIAYVNLVGGQDELVFDGESLFVDATGCLRARAPQFRECLLLVDVVDSWLDPALPAEAGEDLPEEFEEPLAEPIDELEGQFFPDTVVLEAGPDTSSHRKDDRAAESSSSAPIAAGIAERLEPDAEVYAALRLGVRDYVNKNGFRDVVIGLSGGIDSALTAALAADALGPERVLGVTMPSRYNSPTSRAGAKELARRLGIRLLEIPIEGVFDSFEEALAPAFDGAKPDVAEENIQARIRGVFLMALSNKWGHLVLTTGNKSELAVGYCTLYGDMAGGFAVIKDVPKTLVYRLARYRNRIAAVIPEDTLERPPSAELRESQTDQDLLPPYEVLDAIVKARLEDREDPSDLIARGFDSRWVETVYRWIDAAEYKRRQAPPGIKITPRAFGRDRRFPITNRCRRKV